MTPKVLQVLAAAVYLSRPFHTPSSLQPHLVGFCTFSPVPKRVSLLPLLANRKGHFLGKLYLIPESRLHFSVNP